MSLIDAMNEACRQVGINIPSRAPAPGRWVRTDALDEKRGKASGAVTINDDLKSGCAWNHKTGMHQRFWLGGSQTIAPIIKRDPEAERRREIERKQVEASCKKIVAACEVSSHPYLANKGFPDELGLVCDDVRPHLPEGKFGDIINHALPETSQPFLIVPCRIGSEIKSIQFITTEGVKKNILHGQMSGAYHRISTGQETWVCEGIATALSVRAALRMVSRSATVLCAFSASNVGKVAAAIPGAIICADNDKPADQFGGVGAGEFYASRSGLRWVMPPDPGDFNDMHQAAGLREVAMMLRSVGK